MIWVQVVVHICEYSTTHAYLDSANIRRSVERPPIAREVDLIVERTTELLEGGATDGRCHMTLVVETLLEARGSKDKSKPSKLSDDSHSTHVSNMVKLARFGLSPKVAHSTKAF